MLNYALENNLDLVCCDFQRMPEDKTQKKYSCKNVKIKKYNKFDY